MADDQDTQVETQDTATTTEQPQLKEPEITLVADTTAEVSPPDSGGADIGGEGGGGVDIVALGKLAWDVVKDNSPVSNQTTDNAGAIPSVAAFTDLTGWNSDPRMLKIHYHTENILGSNVTDIDLVCEWYFNGQYKGVGQYINDATVYASVDAAFGSKVNIKASFGSPINVGADGAPVAALPVRLTIQESNFAQNFTNVWSGQIKGNGAGFLKPE